MFDGLFIVCNANKNEIAIGMRGLNQLRVVILMTLFKDDELRFSAMAQRLPGRLRGTFLVAAIPCGFGVSNTYFCLEDSYGNIGATVVCARLINGNTWLVLLWIIKATAEQALMALSEKLKCVCGGCLVDYSKASLPAIEFYALQALFYAMQRGTHYCLLWPGEDVEVDVECIRGGFQSIMLKTARVNLQPVFDVEAKRIVGAEALVRFDEGLPILPEIIAAIEDTPDIVALDAKMAELVCQLLNRWKNRNTFYISLNMARASVMQDDFVAGFVEMLRRYEIAEKMLAVEITETGVTSVSVDNISGLKNTGCKLMIDDYGACSALSLQLIEADFIKIDRSLLEQAMATKWGAAVYEEMVAMCARLGKIVIAEGVETEQQLGFVRSTGCRLVQGFIYSRPINVEVFEQIYLGGVEVNAKSSVDGYCCTGASGMCQ